LASVWIALLVLAVAGFNAPSKASWLIAGVLASVGAYVIGLNWSVIVQFNRRGKHSSRVPLLGAVLVALAMMMTPNRELQSWSWAPFVIDPGSVLMLGQLGWHFVSRR
jgi:hypothetical protein